MYLHLTRFTLEATFQLLKDKGHFKEKYKKSRSKKGRKHPENVEIKMKILKMYHSSRRDIRWCPVRNRRKLGTSFSKCFHSNASTKFPGSSYKSKSFPSTKKELSFTLSPVHLSKLFHVILSIGQKPTIFVLSCFESVD